ncbi:hypothetical protein J2Y56_004328 [Pseudomonas sp. BE134]|nr:hypothetical protein [Pseudomonas sp. BE134]
MQSVAVEQYAQEQPTLDLVAFFSRPVQARGLFQNRSGEVVKRFHVQIESREEGQQLILERFLYSDGTRQRRVGTLQPAGAGRWRGRADDVVRLEEKIAKLKTQMKELQAIEIQLNESPDKQVSLTDPDARSMMTRGTGIVGYNVQTAVDTQHHLIVAHEVTNVGSDRDQLSSMAKQAREAMASDTLSANRGYFKSE